MKVSFQLRIGIDTIRFLNRGIAKNLQIIKPDGTQCAFDGAALGSPAVLSVREFCSADIQYEVLRSMALRPHPGIGLAF